MSNSAAIPSDTREGLNITLELRGADIAASDVWTVAGWRLQFVRLDANTRLGVDHSAGQVYIKVITGELVNIEIAPFAAARSVRDSRVDSPDIEAGQNGALLAMLTATDDVRDNIRSMDQLSFAGPHQELLRWASFEEKFGKFTDAFDGQDAHIVPGFHLLDHDGVEIVYVHFWAAGKGVDLSTHNHGNPPSPMAPAFAEVHWVFNNGTGSGGMYECEAPGASHRQRYPIQRGQEHGAFFVVDPHTGRPRIRDNGSVEYPWHGWLAGTDDRDGQAFDFVAAFEINPDYVKV